MKETLNQLVFYIVIAIGVCLGIAGILLIFSIPLAIIGWIVLAFINIFGTVEITYFHTVITGLVVVIIGSIFK